jgi:transcription antitermination factor NusG
MTKSWYAIHSHPNKEELLYQQIVTRGYEVFYPRMRVHPVNPRARKIKAYFPGYLFINVDLTASGLSVFQWMPFSTGLVRFGGEPSIVPDNLISAVRQRVGEIAEAGGELFDGLEQGDPVVIHSGPFAGYEAIFDLRISGNERVRVLLKMLNDRDLPIELDSEQIEKKRRRQNPPSSTRR